MAKINLLIIAVLTSLMIQTQAADMPTKSFVPIEWQVVTLQENIEKKIIKSLSPVISEDEFIIEVKINVDKEEQNSPSSKIVTKTKQGGKIQFNNSDVPTNSNDYVIFNKFGIEAPIVGNEPTETETSESELQQKALIELNDRYNIFQYLKGISINLTFDKNLPAKTKETVQKIIAGLSFNLDTVVPQINLQFLDLKGSKIAKIENDTKKAMASNLSGDLKNILPKEPEKNLIQKMENIDLTFGIILASIIIAAALYYYAKKSMAGDSLGGAGSAGGDANAASGAGAAAGAAGGAAGASAGGASGAAAGEGAATEGGGKPGGGSGGGGGLLDQLLGKDEEQSEEDDMKIDLTKTDPLTTKINEGLERFRKCFTNHQGQTVLMLKGMIKASTPKDTLALRSFIQVLPDHELAEIFNLLTIEERSSWKISLGEELTKEEVAKGFSYIGLKVMELMMVPSFIDDYEICDLLLDITAQEAAKFSQEDPFIGLIFINVLSPNIVSEMFKLMPDETAIELIGKTETMKKQDVIDNLNLLKEKLSIVQTKRQKSPFIMRIFEILPTAKPEIERRLYTTLLKNYSLEEVKASALKTFPSTLCQSLPTTLYKNIVALMPMELQVQYFASMSDADRAENLDRFATKGSKSRDMLDLELSTIVQNEIQLRRLQRDKAEELKLEFLGYTRNYIAQNHDAQKEVKSIVEEWLSELNNDISYQESA